MAQDKETAKSESLAASTEEAALFEKQLSSEKVYDGKLLKVYSDRVELPDGRTSKREYIRHNGAVCVAALDDRGRIVVERQFRYPFGKVLTELPAGKLDGPDEDPLAAAARELKEETGITAEKMVPIGSLIPTCAYSTELIHLFYATGLDFGERQLDEGEFLNVGLMPLDELVDQIMKGEIPDSKTQIAALKVWKLLHS